MLIDGDRAPPDMTDRVKTLASAGLLQQLQLINRQLLRWPEELRRCTSLRTMYDLLHVESPYAHHSSRLMIVSLDCPKITDLHQYRRDSELGQRVHGPASPVRRHTRSLAQKGIVSYALGFSFFNCRHIEGKVGSRNLVTLPSDLFGGLSSLTYLHLGNHHNLVAIPRFDGVPNLRSITLAILLSLTELPSFEKIPELESLMLPHVPRVVAIPDMAPLAKLTRFAVFRPNHLCCNGFLGSCNLEDAFCQYDPVFGIPAATCLEPSSPLIATEATRQVFHRFSAVVCQGLAAPFAIDALSDMPSPDRIASCAGVPYRHCDVPGVTSINGVEGMCYSSRMQVIACNMDPLFIRVRRVEIERGVGPPCDPQEEAWLGCK